MSFGQLREDVYRANMGLVEAGLVLLTWGNASGIDREAGVFAIKPSGVDYDSLTPADLVMVSVETGEVVEGDMRPSSDTPSHLALYQGFATIGAVVHTHSHYATAWAQACREIPALGTTHADQCYGAVPLCRPLTAAEIDEAYELHSGKVIIERFAEQGLNPDHVPAALLPGHGPFAWGKTPAKSLENAIVLEEMARLALDTQALSPGIEKLQPELLDKHFLRKHGPGAYYGQAKK